MKIDPSGDRDLRQSCSDHESVDLPDLPTGWSCVSFLLAEKMIRVPTSQ